MLTTAATLLAKRRSRPVDVSFVGTSRNDRSFVEDISVIQADPVNEVTILDENEPVICSLLTEINRDSKAVESSYGR